MSRVAFYARVSSEKQANQNTIASQIETLMERITADGLILLNEHKFIDNGYSGSNLIRPALDKLRDLVADGEINIIYIHSPDRLARKYAYQMILLEEFEKCGAKVIFLNFQPSKDPESLLLLQMQGMIAEYERSKILERNRRGKIHAAKKGSVGVLAKAAYGYRYIEKHAAGGQAALEIIEEEAVHIREMFAWVAKENLTIGAVTSRLNANKVMTKENKPYWNTGTVRYILKNPIYKGQAAFGKRKRCASLDSVRPKKNNYSKCKVEQKDWIFIEVPAIINESLYEVAQEQLERNKNKARIQNRGATHLLQGLVDCKDCGRAFCGSTKIIASKNRVYSYYRCSGTDAYRFAGNKVCSNSQINSSTLEPLVWEEVKMLLKNPNRILNEYKRRLSKSEDHAADATYITIEKQKKKLENGISLLIDSYAQQYILKEEFEPRIRVMRQNLETIKAQHSKLVEQKKLQIDVASIVTNLENFVSRIDLKLEELEWQDKRNIIKMLVKRIEISKENINIVYKVGDLKNCRGVNHIKPQHCSTRSAGHVGGIKRALPFCI